MKQLPALVFSLVSSQFTVAQNTYDTTYASTYYQQKVTLFRLLPDTKHEIIFLGNSITDIGEWGEIWQNKNVKNRGISGDNTFGVLARLDEVMSSKPEKIFIMIGINDISKDTPDSVIINNYKKIIRQIRASSPATQLYVQSILPTNNEFADFQKHQNKDKHIRFINAYLDKFCKDEKITFVDLYSSFLDSTGKLDKQYTNDGLHINGPGYMKWKKLLIEKGCMK
ncbi:SGNH/GDSL hydrolase family protein [Ferruginibacter profundus]